MKLQKKKKFVFLLLTTYDTDLAGAESGNPNQIIDYNAIKVGRQVVT